MNRSTAVSIDAGTPGEEAEIPTPSLFSQSSGTNPNLRTLPVKTQNSVLGTNSPTEVVSILIKHFVRHSTGLGFLDSPSLAFISSASTGLITLQACGSATKYFLWSWDSSGSFFHGNREEFLLHPCLLISGPLTGSSCSPHICVSA